MANKKKEMNNSSKMTTGENIASIINNIAGVKVAFATDDEDHPSRVKQWIPTSSRVLDSSIARGKLAGIPVGRIIGLAGLPSTGKSYMAAQIAANAQKMGMMVVYFDSENSIDPVFMAEVGIEEEDFIYVQATSCEDVLESINSLLDKIDDKQILFVWDSLAATPVKKDAERDVGDVNGSIALKPRIVGAGLRKLMPKLGRHQSTFLIINQLITNIPTNAFDFAAKHDPYVTPGGNALKFAYSLEIWLTRRKAKSAFVTDEHGMISGAEVVAKMRKSRFGTENRECAFNIEWGDKIGIQDRESWLDAILKSDRIKTGAWLSIQLNSGEWTPNFRATQWLEKLEDPEFEESVLDILDYELIHKYATEGGSHFVDVERHLEEVVPKLKEENEN